MPEPRPAHSDQEVLAAVDVAHAAFGGDRPLTASRAARLASPIRARGRTWILEDDDARVVSSLVCYPLEFALPGGGTRLGFGLGGVGTRPDARGRGHASRLCRVVAEDARSNGRDVGLHLNRSFADNGYRAHEIRRDFLRR